VFDPTGAGDTFAGGFLGQLAEAGNHQQGTLRRSIVYGSTVASFTVENFGLNRLLPLTREQIEERYQRFVDLTDFQT